MLRIEETKWEDVFDTRGFHIENQWTLWKDFRKDDPSPLKLPFSRLRYDMPLKIGKELVITAWTNDGVLLGMCTLFDKRYEHLKIGGIGKMAVNPNTGKTELVKRCCCI